MYLRNSKNAALLGRLDDVGPHPFGVDPLRDRSFRDDGPQTTDAHFRHLLHHVIEARPLERRKDIVDVGAALLRANLTLKPQRRTTLFDFAESRKPFAVPAIENEDLGALSEAQYGGQIASLSLGELNCLAGGKAALYKEPFRC